MLAGASGSVSVVLGSGFDPLLDQRDLCSAIAYRRVHRHAIRFQLGAYEHGLGPDRFDLAQFSDADSLSSPTDSVNRVTRARWPHSRAWATRDPRPKVGNRERFAEQADMSRDLYVSELLR
jgi:hypothetical protein